MSISVQAEAVDARAAVRVESLRGAEAQALAARFPARDVPDCWPAAAWPREQVLELAATTPARADGLGLDTDTHAGRPNRFSSDAGS